MDTVVKSTGAIMTTAKEFLRRIRRLDAIIDCKQAQIDELRARAESVTVPLKPDKIQSGNTGSQADILVRIIDLEWEVTGNIHDNPELREYEE